jgi:hypothetical protein
MFDVQVSDVVTKKRKLHDFLYVPKFAFNLLTVPKATKYGKTFKFSDDICKIINEKLQVAATATKSGILYYLNIEENLSMVNDLMEPEQKKKLWHHRFGHLSEQYLKKMIKGNCVKGLIIQAYVNRVLKESIINVYFLLVGNNVKNHLD